MKTIKALRQSLLRAQQGAVAIEAAIILPLMVFLMLGMVEMYQYFRVISVVDRAAFTVANSVAVQKHMCAPSVATTPSYDPSQLSTYETLMPDLLRPLNPDNYWQVAINFYHHDFDEQHQPNHEGNWELDWNWNSGNGTATPPTSLNANAPTPVANQADGLFVVRTEAEYTPFILSSAFWKSLKSDALTLSSTVYIRPRYQPHIQLLDDGDEECL